MKKVVLLSVIGVASLWSAVSFGEAEYSFVNKSNIMYRFIIEHGQGCTDRDIALMPGQGVAYKRGTGYNDCPIRKITLIGTYYKGLLLQEWDDPKRPFAFWVVKDKLWVLFGKRNIYKKRNDAEQEQDCYTYPSNDQVATEMYKAIANDSFPDQFTIDWSEYQLESYDIHISS